MRFVTAAGKGIYRHDAEGSDDMPYVIHEVYWVCVADPRQ